MQSWPVYDQEQIDAVAQVLASGKVNAWTGPDVRAFEDEYSAYTGAAHAIAIANGTLTLDAALHGLNLQPGDEVIVTPRSFIASASSVMLRGGVPGLCRYRPGHAEPYPRNHCTADHGKDARHHSRPPGRVAL